MARRRSNTPWRNDTAKRAGMRDDLCYCDKCCAICPERLAARDSDIKVVRGRLKRPSDDTGKKRGG